MVLGAMFGFHCSMQATGCCALSVTNDKNSRTALENPGKERMNMMFFHGYHSTVFASRAFIFLVTIETCYLVF